MSLTLQQLEEGERQWRDVRKPDSGEKELRLWTAWKHRNLDQVFQMAKASLLVNFDPTKNAPDRVEENPQPTMKEAIEALRGFAPDFPQEPQPANCCGNCYYWNDEDKTWGNCKYPGVMAGSLPTYCCPMHERNPDATNA